jgi:lipopolysaccharide/colanic/teichoic acid biosynthesis glycosyltransferase
MFINLFKGEMKLVGVRPLSRHYFDLYPKDLQELRIKVKPGLVPPFYADLPQTLEEIIESEREYLVSYQEHPIRTDFKYFFLAWYNILVKKARSN